MSRTLQLARFARAYVSQYVAHRGEHVDLGYWEPRKHSLIPDQIRHGQAPTDARGVSFVTIPDDGKWWRIMGSGPCHVGMRFDPPFLVENGTCVRVVDGVLEVE